MSPDRSKMTARVVPLGSVLAGGSRVGGSGDERVALVTELSEMAWAQTGRPLPDYTRATMPVVVTTRGALAAH